MHLRHKKGNGDIALDSKLSVTSIRCAASALNILEKHAGAGQGRASSAAGASGAGQSRAFGAGQSRAFGAGQSRAFGAGVQFPPKF